MRNILKEKLARGEKPLGTFVGTGSAAVVECLGCAGLDFAILDNEHSPIEAETTARLVCAAERRNITPLARVREISRPAILKLLDVGVQGIIIPDVHSAAEVKRVVDYAKYAPVGQRGFCPSRKDGWGTDTPAGAKNLTDGVSIGTGATNRPTVNPRRPVPRRPTCARFSPRPRGSSRTNMPP